MLNTSVPSVTTRRQNIIPDRFNGKTSWRDYKQHFEASRLANNWSDGQPNIFLAASLQGAAVKVLGNLTGGGSQVSYTELVCWRNDLGLGNSPRVGAASSPTRAKRVVAGTGTGSPRLAALVYPELLEDGRDRLARGHFI